jgi:nucleoside-triphosphatase THEP1
VSVRADMDRVVLLTGERGVGKTRLCQRVVQLAQERGYVCAGVLSPAVFSDGEKVSINLIDVSTGEERLLAVADDAPGDVRWGRYRFAPSTLAWATKRLRRAVPCDLFIVDELGPLELESKGGLVEALDILKGGGFGLGLVVIRPELLDSLKGRLQSQNPRVLRVILSNRDRLPRQILSVLDQEQVGPDLPRQ